MSEERVQANHDTIVFQLGELKGLMAGVLNQVSIANGRTAKNEAKIDSLEKRADLIEGGVKALSEKKGVTFSVWSLVLAFIGTAIGFVGAFATFVKF